MQHAGLTIGMVAIGLGLASIGFNLNGNQANATTAAPVAFNAGPEEPTIVWYGTSGDPTFNRQFRVLRAWSDGTIEMKWLSSASDCTVDPVFPDCSQWIVIASPNEGLHAAADIHPGEIVNAADIGLLVAAWGDAPRNPMPPSECPLGLIP